MLAKYYEAKTNVSMYKKTKIVQLWNCTSSERSVECQSKNKPSLA